VESALCREEVRPSEYFSYVCWFCYLFSRFPFRSGHLVTLTAEALQGAERSNTISFRRSYCTLAGLVGK
jgi:hypothetical protein